MSISFTVDDITRTVHITLRGDLKAEDFISHINVIVEAGVFSYSQLIDARDSHIAITTKDINRFVTIMEKLRATHGVSRVAFVAPDSCVYGMLRMYMALSEKFDSGFKVFREIERAEEWL